MKNVIISAAIVLFALGLSSCIKEKPQQWEYKIVKIEGTDNGKFDNLTFEDPTKKLNNLGEDGWEVVSTYTEHQTVHPNFGNEEYVTGLQPNTRTSVVNFVLKRKVSFKN